MENEKYKGNCKNFDYLKEVRHRYRWVSKLRPQILAIPLYKILKPYEHRRIVEIDRLRLFLDPFSHLGGILLDEGKYEPRVRKIIEDYLVAGSIFLDIGANEGYYAALASQRVGQEGFVIAVEPQSALVGVIEINLLLNGTSPYRIFENVLAVQAGVKMPLNLYPLSNTGAASLVRRYRWWWRREIVFTTTAMEILMATPVEKIDLVKVDVEGYEYEVVRSLWPLLEKKTVNALLVDYHLSILSKLSISVLDIEKGILERGGKAIWREREKGGYVLYRFN